MSRKEKKCLMCGEEVISDSLYKKLFCSKECYKLALDEADELDRRIEFLLGEETSYCKIKLEELIC